jgi:TIR domain
MKRDPAFFISYSRKDFSYAARLVHHLREFGLPVWFDGDLRIGAWFSLEIRERIRKVIQNPSKKLGGLFNASLITARRVG